MRVVFWGTPSPAVPALEALLAEPGIDVCAVVTNPDRPAGRGYELRPSPVKIAAGRAAVPVWQPGKPREVLEDLDALRVDACAVVAYGSILPLAVLQAGGRGFVNLHFSLLPAWRGAAPVAHSLLAGDVRTGVTCFVLDKGMDTGPVLLGTEIPIGSRETAGELTARLAELGAPVLVEAVRGFVEGSLTPVVQDDTLASYAPKIDPGDALLEWSEASGRLDRAIRAFNPAPGAHTTFRGWRLKIHTALPVEVDGPHGEIVRADPDGPVVACGSGGLRLQVVQPAGKARMGGAEFVNGYRPVGERLGR
ncbi:MAG: methionyl-tRNA formyltransferase [Egibacteraceae bacterium]